jgi:hypothetical protein
VTFSNIWNAFANDLAASKAKGIYTDGNYWAINADILQSGAIRIGGAITDSSKPWEGAKFYAAMDNSAVYIAGWEVTNDRLVYIPSGKSLGDAGTFGIYPSGNSETLSEDQFGFNGKLVQDDAWVITAGTGFGVTKFGKLFARDGEIGGWSINSTGIWSGKTQIISGSDSSYRYNSLISDGKSYTRFTCGDNIEIPEQKIELEKRRVA